MGLNAVKTEFMIMSTVQKLNQLDSEPDVTYINCMSVVLGSEE